MTERSWEALLQAARAAHQAERPHDALQLCDRAALRTAAARYAAAQLRGTILMELGDAAGALSSYDSVADPAVPDAHLDCSRGLALCELARFAEAENALHSALRGDPQLAEAHFALGLMAEISGRTDATEHFRRARRLAPQRFAQAPRMTTPQFEALVQQALLQLPARVRQAMRGSTVLVCELPRLEDLRQSEPPLGPQSLGMHVALADGSDQLSEAALTRPAVLLFKRNFERAFAGEAELVAAMAATIMDEVVAMYGLPEGDDLQATLLPEAPAPPIQIAAARRPAPSSPLSAPEPPPPPDGQTPNKDG